MRDRLVLILYLGAVVLTTSVHDLFFLTVALGVVSLLAGAGRFRIARRAALAVLVFNSVVTLSYAYVSWLRGVFSPSYVALINLRVYLLTYMTFLLNERVNLLRALGFSRTLMYVSSLAYSQVVLFRRLLVEFRHAVKSRTLERLSLADLYRHRSRTASFFLSKSMADAAAITEAMRSRGFFND